MATIKSYTDIEQSKKLAEILQLESADMAYWKKSYLPNDYAIMARHTKELQEGFEAKGMEYIPCWSLAALLDILPKNIKSPFGEINPFVGHVDVKDYRCVYLDGDWDSNVQTQADNPIDACVAMIEKLHELKLLQL